eukprot:m.429784 g.429784  ORF g.429784 m.429784 type:complete len:65 (-) comp17063_c0_seq1:7-201(-)
MQPQHYSPHTASLFPPTHAQGDASPCPPATLGTDLDLDQYTEHLLGNSGNMDVLLSLLLVQSPC